MLDKLQKYRPVLIALVILLLAFGIWLRFNNILHNGFLFYDEGYYLNDDRRTFVEYVRKLYPHSFSEILQIIWGDLRISLGSGKALWIFLINLRALTHTDDDWCLSRVISAVFGCLTLWVVYLFAKRYYQSKPIGILSAVLLAVMPSHVFYSRTGMQEALSTFCFLLGFYFYIFPRGLNWRTFLSSFFFVLAYFTNYRLILIPIFVAFCELYTFLSLRQVPDFRKYIWHTLAFLGMIVFIGSLDRGQHLQVILPWMFHQVNMAKHEPFHWFNLFSYPYFTFRLETFFFGLFFWANIYYVFKRKWYQLYPFFQVLVQMLVFSLPEEKGARYVAVVYPFMVTAVAFFLAQFFEERKLWKVRVAWALCGVVMIFMMTSKSWVIARAQFGYRQAMNYLLAIDKDVKAVTSQMWIMDLYTKKPDNVLDLPHTFPHLLQMYGTGFRYVVLDPQVYISWGEGEQRFNPKLQDYLDFVVNHVKPIKSFPHLNPVLLERFVFEHNSNLLNSIKFLEQAKGRDWGDIKIYDMAQPIETILRAVTAKDKQGQNQK